MLVEGILSHAAKWINIYNDREIESMDIYDLEDVYMSGNPPL